MATWLGREQAGALINGFGFRLLRELVASGDHASVFISPYSISLALWMAGNAAAGQTRQEMLAALGLDGWDLDTINGVAAALQADWSKPVPQVQLSMANALYGALRVNFRPAFLVRLARFYAAELACVAFGSPEVTAAINAWVAQQTQGKIPQFFGPSDLGPDTLLVLLNAVYFKGLWTVQFDRSKTADELFYVREGAPRLHPRMRNAATYRYFADADFQAISLPYGDGRFSMDVFLPAEGLDLLAWLRQLDDARWQEWSTRFEERPGVIEVPRCKISYGDDLVRPLAALGMARAFSDQADFSELCDGPAAISQVLHRAVLEVNEEGSEAAAVTAVMMPKGGPSVGLEPFTMVVDRPFFAAIVDHSTGAILFMGAIFDPGPAT